MRWTGRERGLEPSLEDEGARAEAGIKPWKGEDEVEAD
jgi:hypothetical protein